MKQIGTLYFFCGKMGAGKSTKSKQLAIEKQAVLLSEDEWLSWLYPNQISAFEDYLKFSDQLKPMVKKLVQNILSVGTNVVMDFPGNTQKQRKWFLDLVLEIHANHQLIFLTTRWKISCLLGFLNILVWKSLSVNTIKFNHEELESIKKVIIQ